MNLKNKVAPRELSEMCEKKRIKAWERILGHKISLLRTGFIDTRCGAVLTCDEALSAMQLRAAQDSAKRDSERVASMQRESRLIERVQRS